MPEASGRREAALDLLTRYVRVVDDPARLDEWPALFAAEAEYVVITRENLDRNLPIAVIRDDSLDRIHDRVTLIREFWGAGGREEDRHYNGVRTRHVVGPAWVEMDETGRANLGANLLVWATTAVEPDGAPRLLAVGEYRDVIDFTPAGPRLRSKTVILDTPVLSDVIVYPL